MSELVDLLRTPTGCVPPTKWELQAAARIEALEAALRKITEGSFVTDTAYDAIRIARKALASEQDK